MNKEIEKKDVPSNFIRNIIDEDLKNNKNNGEVRHKGGFKKKFYPKKKRQNPKKD